MNRIKNAVKMIMAAVLLSVISMMTTWFVTDAYLQIVLKQYHLLPPGSSVTFSDVVSQMVSSALPSQTQRNTRSGATSGQKVKQTVPPEAAAAFSQKQTQNKQLNQKGQSAQMAFSNKEIAKMQSSLSSEDKMKIISILSKLPQQQIKTIMGYLSGGITQAELVKIQNMIRTDVTKNEYEQLMNILNKYKSDG